MSESISGHQFIGSVAVFVSPDSIVVGSEDYAFDGENEFPVGAEYQFTGDERLRLAALALHGYFTWQHVDRIRNIASEWEKCVESPEGDKPDPDLLNLADLIAALLPPREAA